MAKTEKNDKKNFETQLARLQAVVDRLERGDASLEQSLELFKEGQELVKDCRKRLAAARHQVEVFSRGEISPLNPDTEPENDTSHEL